MKVDVDVQLTVMASSLYRILARRIGSRGETRKPAQLFRKFVNAAATVDITECEIVVSYGRRDCSPFLADAGPFETAERLPWRDGRTLRLRAIRANVRPEGSVGSRDRQRHPGPNIGMGDRNR